METNVDGFEPPKGASIWERELFIHLIEHARRESELLEKYVEAAEETGSEAFAYVVRLLANDEKRHHGQMADLARTLKAELELRDSDLSIPRPDFDKVDRKKVLDLTRELLDNEKSDAKALKQLRKDLKFAEDVTLWGMLVETMQTDTEKHLNLLRYVERQVSKKR